MAQKKRAHALYEESKQAYKTGEFERAASLLEEAYANYAIPVLLYNLARAKESAGDNQGAISAYQKYLDSGAEIEDRAAIQTRIATLEEQAKDAKRREYERKNALERARHAEKEAADARKRERSQRVEPETPTPWGWLILGTGAATLLAGGVLGVLARSQEQAAGDAAAQTDAQDQFDQAQQYATIANTLFAIGGVATLTGSLWLGIDWLGDGEPAAGRVPPPSTAPRLGSRKPGSYLGMRLSGRF